MNDRTITIPWENGRLRVSKNGRFLAHENGKPFFWLGDTGWLLFSKLDKAEAEIYLEDRRLKGFNVIQVMVLHEIDEVNVYGKSALLDKELTHLNVSEGEYGYWEHIDFITDLAAKKGLYLAMVPIWGSVVKNGWTDVDKIKYYGEWLAKRYADRPNIIWLNGGDTKGNLHKDIWAALGQAIKNVDHNHLMTFHPFGRTSSSDWFHNEPWLDFNMFQSGHRHYDQIMKNNEEGNENLWIGQDNWRYVLNDYEKTPVKPTMDGEPSYEGIPHGLHDTTQPLWTDADCRRYAYWSVFAGAFGHTYGNNSVMQMLKPGEGIGSYGATQYWFEAINDGGAAQMQYMKKLMLSVPFYNRVLDQSIIHGDPGSRYERLLATRGVDYLFVYSYTGREFSINMGKITGDTVNARWYNTRNGRSLYIGRFVNSAVQQFTPPGKTIEGNDWVLIVTDSACSYFSI
jgi:hypothetical protein